MSAGPCSTRTSAAPSDESSQPSGRNVLILTAVGTPGDDGGKEIRTPGRPVPLSTALPPGAWKMQNIPVSSVIRWPDTLSSATRLAAAPDPSALAGAGLFTALPASDIAESRFPL